MPHLLDGLKPSYRRMIWTALEQSDKLVKVATLAGICGGKYSPHSADSLPSVISEMVHSRVFDGQGSHGSNHIFKLWNNDAAAPRYIEAKLNKYYREMISPLIPFVPYKESELDSSYKEPLYIPTPFPLAMMFNSLGLGVGIRSVTPNFSPKSMIEAYKKDDYTLLRANGDLYIDNSNSQLKSIWTKGVGKIRYGFNLKKNYTYGKRKGILMYGDARFIQLTKLGKLDTKTFKDVQKEPELGWIDKGFVDMIDVSTRNTGKQIFFAISSSSKGKKGRVTLKQLEAELEKIRFTSSNYKLAVTDGKVTSVKGLKDWIHETYTNFSSLVSIYKKDRLKKLSLRREVALHADLVAKKLIDNPKISKTKIAKELKIDLSIVEECLKKSISVLMNINKSKELQMISDKTSSIHLLTPESFYENIID